MKSNVFSTYAGLKFDIAGNQPDLGIFFSSSTESISSPTIPLSAFNKTVISTGFTSLLIDFTALPGSGAPLGNGTWDRITFQAGGNGATYHVDNIILVSSIVVVPEFLSAEPIGSNTIAITTQGVVDLAAVKITLGGTTLKVSRQTTYVPVGTPAKSITYLTLSTSFAVGALIITAGTKTFSFNLPSPQIASINQNVKHPINPYIYGVNFPPNGAYIKNLGIPLARWGGNAVSTYNPEGHYTNAGSDWFFENHTPDEGSADDWLGWVSAAGSATHLTIPALDWVSKDSTSYSYPRTLYPDQGRFDPYKPDAGSGRFPNGTYITPNPDPLNVYVAWNTTGAKKWLTGLVHKPTVVTIDNEIEIAHSTHQDAHPQPLGYDEILDRVVRFSIAAKEALPTVQLAAPSTCAWWFYWTSALGYTDNAAHGNIDFVPWFLMEMNKQEAKVGKRLLDYLDLHYYFASDTKNNTDADKALRLRATRSLWDTTYIDESRIGTDTPQNHQPNANIVSLIPRLRALVDQHYPGTKLSISEWASTADSDLTGGLVTADVLGIFGKFKLDSATYWETPNEVGPVGLAYWLYRGYGSYFGSCSAQVTLATPLYNTQSVYAGTEGGKLTLVIINKNPTTPLSFSLSNVVTGKYFMRHFGGLAGVAKWQTTITIGSSSYVVIPAYTAVFLKQI